MKPLSAVIVPRGVETTTSPPLTAMPVALVFSCSEAPAAAATRAVPTRSLSGWMWPVPASRTPPQ